MLIRLDEIPPEGLKMEVRLEPETEASGPFRIEEPFAGSFTIRKLGPEVLVRGTLRGDLVLECSRCLNEFHHGIQEEIDLQLRPVSLMESSEERELANDDLDVEFFRGDALDLNHILAEQISLALPMKPLCSEECGGLCPLCGGERKEAACSCDEESFDPRWEALRSLKDKI
ncbi:MAG: DUF177 domain-containing protein [bacterium]|nr:MAG: DUF177 domain-containing protein [bacterium]